MCTGAASIGLVAFLFREGRKPVVALYGVFLFALFCMLLASIAFVVLFFAGGELGSAGIALNTILFASVGYDVLLIALRFRSIGDRTLKRALIAFLLGTAIFFPALYLDSIRNRLATTGIPRFFTGWTLPLYFLLLNEASYALALRYFARPPYWNGAEVTPFFCSSFDITPREAEIVGSLASGRSLAEIAQALFISAKTVENHVYSVYQKTGVKNRVQLSNLLMTNSVK